MLLYFLATVPAIFFGIINLTLLIPLLEVLFNQASDAATLATLTKPTFGMSLHYLKFLFAYLFTQIIDAYGRLSA